MTRSKRRGVCQEKLDLCVCSSDCDFYLGRVAVGFFNLHIFVAAYKIFCITNNSGVAKRRRIGLSIKVNYYKGRQEAARKDVERAFGVLQSRWGIIRGPSRTMDLPHIGDIMYACIILHNMIVEDEGRNVENWVPDDGTPPLPPYNHGAPQVFVDNLHRFVDMRSSDQHMALQMDLIEELWARRPE